MKAHGARWADETIRLYRRYEQEIVDACGLCPWASPARRDGRVTERVLLQGGDAALEPSLDAIASLTGNIDLALFIFPRLNVGRKAFEGFAARVHRADGARQSSGESPFIFAVFHPDAKPILDDPERLVPFLRRTPDPTIQLVRGTLIDRIRATGSEGTRFADLASHEPLAVQPPSVSERIAHNNWTTTLRIGIDELGRRLDDIIRDREQTQRRLSAVSP